MTGSHDGIFLNPNIFSDWNEIVQKMWKRIAFTPTNGHTHYGKVKFIDLDTKYIFNYNCILVYALKVQTFVSQCWHVFTFIALLPSIACYMYKINMMYMEW